MLFIYSSFRKKPSVHNDNLVGTLNNLLSIPTVPQTSTMEKTCDRNQNVCDNNISNINSNSEKTLCDEKQEDPSILVQKFSAILPSNFLNLSPRFVLSKIVRLTDRR